MKPCSALPKGGTRNNRMYSTSSNTAVAMPKLKYSKSNLRRVSAFHASLLH